MGLFTELMVLSPTAVSYHGREVGGGAFSMQVLLLAAGWLPPGN